MRITIKIMMSYNNHLSEKEFEDFFEKGLEDLKKDLSKGKNNVKK